jgi:cytochrome oxidase Cu insertion factor (SCO1/SenC/PrrC family)
MVNFMGSRILIALMILASLSCTAPQSSVTSPDELKPRDTPLQVAEMAPDFTLEDQQNRKITLSEARSETPVMLVFYRGNW